MSERNVTIGAGPFQPPSASELRDIHNELNDLKAERVRIAEENTRFRSLLSVRTDNDLTRLLHQVLPEAADISVRTDIDGDLEVTVEGLTLNDSGEIVQPEREFEVSTTITFEHRATIRATDEDTARDLYAEYLSDSLFEVDLEIVGSEIEDQDSYPAEHDFIAVNEL